jgi:hypothetical protein
MPELFALKKYFLYWILILTLLDAISFCQIAKLPLLIKHYQEHQMLCPEMDLMDFFEMHYWGEDINDNDAEKDKQLPFKSLQMHVIVFVKSGIPLPSFHLITLLIQEEDNVEGPLLYRHQLLTSLFRPPQV